MKKMLAVIVFAALASLIAHAEGYAAKVSNTFTNTWTWTNTESSPRYIERVDFKCSSVTGVYVRVSNVAGVTNTIVCDTNTLASYTAAYPIYRVEQGGTVTFLCDEATATNTVILYPCIKIR